MRGRRRRFPACGTANGVVGVNIGAGTRQRGSHRRLRSGIATMSAVADYLTINISSPNTRGLRDLQAPEVLAALLGRVQEARGLTWRLGGCDEDSETNLDGGVGGSIPYRNFSGHATGMGSAGPRSARDFVDVFL